MAKSRLIKDLACGKISISDALYRLLVIAGDIDNDILSEWASSEINGYSQGKDVPDYRIIHSFNFQYSGINGGFQVSNSSLNPLVFDEETLDSIGEIIISEGVRSIETKADSQKSLHRDLTYLSHKVFVNSGGIRCFSISQIISPLEFVDVLSAIKTKLIIVLQKLEKEYGNIDDLDVGTEEKTKQEKEKLDVYIEKLIYENKSVSIGDQNNISKSEIEAGKNE